MPIVRNPPPSVQTLPPSTKPGKGYGQGSAPGSRPVPALIPVSVPTPVPTIRIPTNSQMSHGTRNIISSIYQTTTANDFLFDSFLHLESHVSNTLRIHHLSYYVMHLVACSLRFVIRNSLTRQLITKVGRRER